MATKDVWDNYRSRNLNKGTDKDILSMMRDVVDTIHNLEKMYGARGSQLVVRGLLLEWHALAGMADARGLRNYKRP